MHGYECEERLFGWAAFYGDFVYFSPYWGNMFVRLDKKSGAAKEWKPGFDRLEKEKNGYYISWSKESFVSPVEFTGGREYLLFSPYDRKLYQIELETGNWKEIRIGFKKEDLLKGEAGFQRGSQWLQYCCMEGAFNSLSDFLDGNITGHAFDKQSQLEAYGSIAANHDGTSGEKTYRYVKEKLRNR